MKTNILSLLLVVLLFSACSDMLDKTPQGVLVGDEATSTEYADPLVISAYAIWVTGADMNASFTLGNYEVRSDDCYKGGAGPADGDVFHVLEISQGVRSDQWNINDIWRRLYICITRANTALTVLDKVDENAANRNERIAEMRFLRGHAHFLLKQLFHNIVMVDETIPQDDYATLSNTTYTNDEEWQLIADDFQYAYDNLPVSQTDKGRPTRAAAAAYLAKTYLYKAYRQDEQYNVISIDQDDLNQVLTYTNAVITDGQYGLENDYSRNFRANPEFENGKESLWAIQYSIDDGTQFGNVNFGTMLSVPLQLGGQDFRKPSQNLVNSFKTLHGLPEFDNYNDEDYDPNTDTADPRLYHTVAIPGYPYKYNSNYIFDDSWSRNKDYYGVYSSLKENVDPDSPYRVQVNDFWANSMNYIVLRYADVLLMRAEALIELHRSDEALTYINEVRSRAINSNRELINYAPNLDISLYDANKINWTEDYARRALRWERRLEFGMENCRFFDLVRWGIADQVINAFYRSEESKRTYYSEALFTKNKNEYLPIPYSQIAASAGHYTQNYGWTSNN
ncbi:MAG TPA: RagB/SusD family nutrient uptake outer membrane protein [Bacteroidaceae bacterium]|nr:RagB/SusD family nutrient uptake outer membrane protein [Bacteroidaceae bacterium]